MTSLYRPLWPRRSTAVIVAVALGVLGSQSSVSVADTATDVAVAALVKVTCRISDTQKLVSSGFLWPDNGYIVTALHGVVGCTSRLNIKSALTASVRWGHVVKVSHEGDLALVRLVDADDKPQEFSAHMKALQITTSEPVPKVLDRYSISGFPGGGPRFDDHISFRGGERMVWPLGRAFPEDNEKRMQQLLASQSYPKSNTQIVRVGTTLTSGQSGAPIVDADGKLIAIADGGLGGGYLMMNWGIVAHTYLKNLPGSEDPMPKGVSEIARANLISAILPSEVKAVEVPQGAIGLRHVRRLPLYYMYELMSRRKEMGDEPFAFSGVENIRDSVSQDVFKSLAFDIYEDPYTGATVGVPSTLDLIWSPDSGALVAGGGEVYMLVGVNRFDSYDEARVAGLNDFVGKIEDWAHWERHPATIDLSRSDDFEWANGANFFDGSNGSEKISMNMSISVSGDVLLGYVLYATDVAQLPNDQFVNYMMMQTALLELADFAL